MSVGREGITATRIAWGNEETGRGRMGSGKAREGKGDTLAIAQSLAKLLTAQRQIFARQALFGRTPLHHDAVGFL